MKAIFEFSLPEDQEDFEIFSKATDYYYVLSKYDEYLRSKIKYAPDNMSDDTYKAFQEAREHLRELVIENRIEL